MTAAEMLAAVGQFGLPLTLLIAVVLDFRRERKRWEDLLASERKRYEDINTAEREKCAKEREEWNRERATRTEHERLAGEKQQALILKMNEQILTVAAQLERAAEVLEDEKKEIREARERELRDTGQHSAVPRQQWKPPGGR